MVVICGTAAAKPQTATHEMKPTHAAEKYLNTEEKSSQRKLITSDFTSLWFGLISGDKDFVLFLFIM